MLLHMPHQVAAHVAEKDGRRLLRVHAGLVLAWLVAAFFHGACFGQTLELAPGAERWNLVPYTGCLKEPLPAESARDALPPDGPFVPLSSDVVNLGLHDREFWFRFTLHNASAEAREFCIALDNPRIGRAELFLPKEGGGFDVRKAGLLVPRQERASLHAAPTFPILMKANQTATVYLRVKNRGWFLFRMLLWDKRAYAGDQIWRGLGIGMLYGGLLLMALQSALTFFWIRDRSFLYNAALVGAALMYEVTFQGTASQYFWPNSPWWADRAIIFFLGLAMAAVIAVSRSFLATSLTTPRLDKVLRFFLILSLLVPLGKLTDSLLTNLVMHAIGCLAPPVILAAAILCWRKRAVPASMFLAAWGVLLVGAVCFNLAGVGILPWTLVTECALHLGVGVSPLLFSLALLDRVRVMEVMHRENLEKQVAERTSELREALANVKTLRGLVPICSSCKKVREDSGYWKSIEWYVQEHSEADFTHGLCPECLRNLYGEDLGPRVEQILDQAGMQ